MLKQTNTMLLAVSFSGIDLDEVSQIEFIFKQLNSVEANTLKSALWVKDNENETAIRETDTNTIDIPWSKADTALFVRNAPFYMDTRITYSGSIYNPLTPITQLVMMPSLFKQNEVVSID